MFVETKLHITFDEYGSNDLFYTNDSLFIRCNIYDGKDKMIKKNHLALFILKGAYYQLAKKINLEISEWLLNKSGSFMDYTNGSFYQNSSVPNYFFFHQPLLYESYTNIELPYELFITQNDTGSILSAANFHEFTILLVSYQKLNVQFVYFINHGEVIKLNINLEDIHYPVSLHSNGISYINIEKKIFKDIIFKPNYIVNKDKESH
jgi:hypothetical protein